MAEEMDNGVGSGNSKCRILVIGGTGYIGNYIVRASLSMGHPTFVYGRPVSSSTPASKLQLVKDLQSMGITFFQGELNDQEKLVWALKQVDVVICAVGMPQLLEQLHVIDAIKAAGNIKRFLPSEFGCEVDSVEVLPPFEACLGKKREVRRALEAAQIPSTFMVTNCCGSYFVNALLHPHQQESRDITVYGTGNDRAVLNLEEDIAAFTVKAATDPATRNRVVILQPPENVVTQNELISLWEKKVGRSFNKVYVPAKEMVKLSQSLTNPENVRVSILYGLFVQGVTWLDIRENQDLEASRMYPEWPYRTVDKLLDIFIDTSKAPLPVTAAFG